MFLKRDKKKVLFHQKKKNSNNIILLIFYVCCVNFQFYSIILDMLASILNKEKKSVFKVVDGELIWCIDRWFTKWEWWKKDLFEVFDQFRASGAYPNVSDAYNMKGQPGDQFPCSRSDTVPPWRCCTLASFSLFFY